MKQTENKETANKVEFKEVPQINRNRLFSSNNLESIIKGLSKPRFLGSFHLKNETNSNINPVGNLIESELKLKMTKALKNTLFNPITKTLIILAIIFNIIWFTLIYFF
ncbi:MAG: hypothetical protein ACFE75_07615 [Candidatus Hodarchaeota archaeon]